MSTLPPSLTLADSEVVRAFVQDYFDAWSGTDEDRILAHYADNVVIELPVGRLDGKAAVRDQFVRPLIAASPGNIHVPLNLAHAPNLVAGEWRFEAVHRGTFTGIPPTGRSVSVPGCSFYQHDLDRRVITGGQIYFDLATLLRQLGKDA
jgi:steroid delta-isomerase-like uncharacterized protein